MTKPHKAICQECGKERLIQNAKCICPDCVFKLSHNGKTKQQVYIERQRQKHKFEKKKKEAIGEKQLFLEIWNERFHYCENKNCHKWLGYEPKAIFFSHRKSKGSYPELRLCKENIDLLCADCHRTYEFGDRNKLELE
jgi:hypothetical protein